MKITAAVMAKPDGTITRRSIQFEMVELEGLWAEVVLVRITSCGVCGTNGGCLHGQHRLGEVNQAIDDRGAGILIKPILMMG